MLRPPVAARRRRRIVAAAVGSVLLLAAGGLGILRSPLFGADRITVEGARHLSAERVLGIAGIGDGTNVVWFDEDAAERSLEADPWIARADVHTDLPDAIVVRITERTPVGAVETHVGWEVVAADGVILETPTRAPDLPTITVAVPGDDVVTLCGRLLGAMSPGLRARVDGLTVDAGGLVTLELRRGIPVTYGGTEEAVEKAQALSAVLDWVEQEQEDVREIDVSVPGAPTARLAGGVVTAP
jgi:cell division protein FtsQ